MTDSETDISELDIGACRIDIGKLAAEWLKEKETAVGKGRQHTRTST